MKAQISVDPRLIPTMGRSLYQGHPAIIGVRELLQNSWDACLQREIKPDIKISLEYSGSYSKRSCKLVCQDNGIGMTDKQLVNDYLRLGSSGKKDSEYSTGGFGIANALVFSCDKWQVITKEWIAKPDDNHAVDITKNFEYYDGTEVTLWFTSDRYESSMVEKILLMVAFSKVDVHLRIEHKYTDDEGRANAVRFDDRCGFERLEISDNETTQHIEELDWAKIHIMDTASFPSGKSFAGYDVVRMNGLVQFTEHPSYKRKTNLILDLEGTVRPQSDRYPLSLSREKLIGPLAGMFETASKKHTVDMISTYRELTDEKPAKDTLMNKVMKGYLAVGSRSGKGTKITDCLNISMDRAHHPYNLYEEIDLSNPRVEKEGNVLSIWSGGKRYLFVDTTSGQQIPATYEMDGVDVIYRVTNFADILEQLAKTMNRVIHNYDDPNADFITTIFLDYKKPDPSMYKKHLKILEAWEQILKYTASNEEPFGVGLTTRTWIHACRTQVDTNPYYVINPTTIIGEVYGNRARAMRLWMLACHECAHRQFDIHDEAFVTEMGSIATATATLVDIEMASITSKLRGLQ